MISKIYIYIMKGHWWFLTLSWLDDDQGTFLTAHDFFFRNGKSTDLSLLFL